MKNSLLVMLVVVTILVGGVPWAIREAHYAGPVIQVVEINGHRTRFDNANPAFVRYLLRSPSNADPTIDGFAPIDPLAVLMLFIGGDGTLNLTLTQQSTGSTNFLARTRYHFAAEGYVVALVDAASDFLDHNHDDTRDTNGFLHGSGLRDPSRPSSRTLRTYTVLALGIKRSGLAAWRDGLHMKGKVALVTGSSGIGRASALAFLKCTGGRTGPQYRTKPPKPFNYQKLGGEVIWIQTDVSNAAQVRQMVHQTVARFGRIDNAGNGGSGGNGRRTADMDEH